jgi:beta-galactosidase
MNWEVYPKGLYVVTQDLAKRYQLPIIITENGVADRHDKLRTDYIKEALYWVFKSRTEGANIFGYIHWALTDNYEWAHGYKPRFGLIEIDYEDYTRTIRPSALVYQELIKKYQQQIANEPTGNTK